MVAVYGGSCEGVYTKQHHEEHFNINRHHLQLYRSDQIRAEQRSDVI